MDRQAFLKHAAVYGVANVLLQAGNFLFVPLYLRCLSPAEFGVLEVVGRLAETAGICLLCVGLMQALYALYQQAETELDRRRVVCAAFGLCLVVALAGAALALVFGPTVATWLSPLLAESGPGVTPGLVQLALLAVLLEPFVMVPQLLTQARLGSLTYVSVVFGQFVLRLTLAITLVRFLRWGVAGALTATATTFAVFGILLSLRELARGLAWPRRDQWAELLRFALPLVPGGICFLVLHHGDRFLLVRHAPAAEVGTYALGYKLALTVSLFSLHPLSQVWSARMYEVARTPEAPEVFGRAFTRLLATYALAGLALCLFAEEAVLLLGGPDYLPAAAVVAPVMLACVFQGAATLFDAGLYIRRRTGLKLIVTFAATAVMVGLYAWLIPAHGSMGAALATLGGFAFLAVATWVLVQRIFPVRYEWGRLSALLALAIGLWLMGRAVPAGPWLWPAKAALWLAAPVLAWLTGLVSAEEKQVARAFGQTLLYRLRRPAGAAADARV
jgi:O-antigen/teichoic acid export membrane protein